MEPTYRITVRGRLSERFCHGVARGMRHRVDGDRTVMEGLPDERAVADVLAALGNLGVEVIDVRGPATIPSTQEEA